MTPSVPLGTHNSGLKLAVHLAVSQLDQGIGLAEAVQFAAKYHNVTCAAIESELSRKTALSDRWHAECLTILRCD
jgi:hypothetical protein